jgi:hypothetical protein
MRLGECNGCKMGRHKDHVRNHRPAPEGMFGGTVCPCKGECRDKTREDIYRDLLGPQGDVIAKAFARARAGTGDGGVMPDHTTIEAATPKCPCFISQGPDARRCVEPMRWHDDRRVWVCERRHPHMETTPDGVARLAPKPIRDAVGL